MRDIFTTFAASRFIDQEEVVAALRRCAARLKSASPEVVAVHLLGSFATRRATPRSDGDILVEVASDEPALKEVMEERARDVFLEAPVPVDLFVASTARLAEGRGVAGAVGREGVRIA
jgi:predicted nucleotidyltransferase